MIDTLTLQAYAGEDAVSCNQNPVLIGGYSRLGVVYDWGPTTGLSDPTVANPRANPISTTAYVLTVRSTGGGCVNSDTVVVTASYIDSSLQVLGKPAFCITTGDSAVLLVQPTDSILWLRDDAPISGANQDRFRVIQTGNYFARLMNSDGCFIATRRESIQVETPRPGIIYPPTYAVINEPLQLQARTFGTSVLWKPPVWLDDPESVTPFFDAPRELEQLYSIEIKTASGCLTVDTLVVKTIKEIKIYVPSAFTPNNDGRNDYLRPILFGIKELKYFRVYNRWGQLIYDMQAGQRGWDGTINGLLQQTGVFVWIAQGIGLDNKIYSKNGTTVLVR